MTRGERVIVFIERFCQVPEGDLVGQPVRLLHFQKKFILDVYDNPDITDTAILSIARKNAKTATIAFLVLVHLVGPESKQNSRIISGALSRDQAAEVFNYASKTVQLSERLRGIVKIIDSKKTLVGLLMNVTYQAISAEAKTSHGKSPIVAILDEVGQIRGPQSDFVDAVTTAQGAYEEPLLIYISTQAATDNDFFSIQIDDAQEHKPPKTVCHVYAADEDANPLDQKQWYKANPALGIFRSFSDMEKQAKKAARIPSFENTFRNLNLNQRVESTSPLISRGAWDACKTAPPAMERMEIYGGLDLSARLDLTSAVFNASVADQLYTWPFFWMPKQGLRERAKRDRQPYDVWAKQGLIRLVPGNSVDYEWVAADIMKIIGDNTLISLAFDRWRIDIFKRDCERLGISLPLVPFGQGYKDMSPAIEAMEEHILNRELMHGNHPVLRMCIANAVATMDPAGNRKLDKAKATGRIDGAQALAMSIGARLIEPPAGPSVYETRGLRTL